MSKKEIAVYGIGVAILLWFILSTIEVWLHSTRESDYIYSRANVWAIMTTHTNEMKVVDCRIDKPTDTWLVTVEDIAGNQYQYYDTEIQYNGWIKTATMQGNLVVNIK